MDQINPVLGEAEFEKAIQEASEPFVYVDFWAEWCGPCRLIHPMLERITQDPELKDKIKIVQVDIEEEANRPLVVKYQIMSIPNMVLFGNVNGKKEMVARRIGVSPEPVFRDWLNKVMTEFASEGTAESANTEPEETRPPQPVSTETNPEAQFPATPAPDQTTATGEGWDEAEPGTDLPEAA